jgi:uncharacterized membrane protein YccC
MLAPSSTVLGALSVLSMILGFSFNPKNYRIGTTFITIYVVFLFAILTPNLEGLIQYRILDTVVGVILGMLANHFLWPFWEFLNIPEYLEKAIVANRNYIKEFSALYNKKGETSQSYRLARNQAFIEVGNLMASFQRMVQEPKSKQNKLPLYYKLTVLNHTLLSSAASLGTYTQSKQTTEASEAFNKAINKIINKLDYAILLLKNNKKSLEEIEKNPNLNENFKELKEIQNRELELSISKNETQNQEKIQEVQLVIEQLIWVNNLTENIVKTTKRVLNE